MTVGSSVLYSERVVSRRTEALFILLMALCALLLTWRVLVAGLDPLAGVLLFLSCFFLLYSLNYRALTIRLTPESLRLSFGVFSWAVPLANIRACRLDDDLPALARYGGAGIHFLFVHNRYRASFNFLEHPRVVVELKNRAGLVRDISFSTCEPQELLQRIQWAVAASGSA